MKLTILPKSEWMNLVFLHNSAKNEFFRQFFWKNLRIPKSPFEINWPLQRPVKYLNWVISLSKRRIFKKKSCNHSSLFLGFNLYFYGSLHIVSITSLLVLSIEWILRRYWMLHCDLWQKHGDSYHPTQLVFLGHISLHLSLSWTISSQIQPNS